MDKKFEDKLAKLAFGELSEAEAKEVRAHAAADADAAQALASYEALRSDLRRMKDVPPDQLSKERLQTAILTQGLKPKPVRRAFPWAWISSGTMVAAMGALAFVMITNKPQPPETVAINEPSILGPGDSILIDQSIKGFAPDITTQTAPVATSVAAPKTDQLLTEVSKPVRIRSLGSRTYHPKGYRGAPRPIKDESLTLEPEGPAIPENVLAAAVKKAPETLVLIKGDRDNNTGVSNAVEVHQTEDVIVSS